MDHLIVIVIGQHLLLQILGQSPIHQSVITIQYQPVFHLGNLNVIDILTLLLQFGQLLFNTFGNTHSDIVVNAVQRNAPPLHRDGHITAMAPLGDLLLDVRAAIILRRRRQPHAQQQYRYQTKFGFHICNIFCVVLYPLRTHGNSTRIHKYTANHQYNKHRPSLSDIFTA